MIRPTGPIPCKIAIVGDAPGDIDEREGVAFSGMGGRVLDGILAQVGIKREECYITCVTLTQPTNGNFGNLYTDKGRKKPTEELLEAHRRLHNELTSARPNVIVALGPEALYALKGTKEIDNWRGSVLESPWGKVIPTVHPGTIVKMWSLRSRCVLDFLKVLENSRYPNILRKERILQWSTSDFDFLMTRLKGIKKHSRYVAFDIETETEQITCISFASDAQPDMALCVPFWFGASGSFWSKEQESELWRAINDILTCPTIGTIGQNGMYDITYLKRTVGIEVTNYELDTMLMYHVLQPEMPKGLDFLTSVYTDHPYYKYQRKTESMEEYFRYNATDSVLTLEIAMKLLKELQEDKLFEFYKKYVHALQWPLLAMQERGMVWDVEKAKELKKLYASKIEEDQDALNKAAGKEINVNSPKQMQAWLYKDLGLKAKTKRRKDTGESTVTADEEAIEELYATTKIESLRYVLEIRKYRNLISTYLDVKLDKDKRLRCSYLITGTETGRLSSRGTPWGTGTNMQNLPSGDVRLLLRSDDGKILLNADLSQAEARVVAYLSNEPRLIGVFASGGDIHKKNAGTIFRKREEDVTDEERQLAKRVVHASNYGMGPNTFAKNAGIPVEQSRRLLNQYFATYPGIRNWHLDMASKMRVCRELYTPFGRRRVFHDRYGDSINKEALAFIPQSTVVEIVNQALIELHTNHPWIELLMQVHDSIVCQVAESRVEEAAKLLKKCLEVPVVIGRHTMIIPSDVKVGYNLQEMKKIKT